MTTFAFSIPTQIQFGAGVSNQAGEQAVQLASGNAGGAAPAALVLCDPGIQTAGWFQAILASLGQAGLPYTLFAGIEPNPKEQQVNAAAALLKAGEANVLLAVGGGSTIDTAKAAALIACHGGQVSAYAGWGKVPGPVTPLVAIPTTAGSGSEVTCWSVISEAGSHAKLAIGDRNLAPATALVDPQVTLSLPAGLTAATGMDALTHAIEAYLCALSSPVNDLLALESMRLVAANLRRAVADGQDLEARQGMMLASTLGGIAINNADVAGVHCLSEALGSLYDAPHGLLNAILLPYCMSFWLAACQERFIHIAEAFNAPGVPEQAVAQVTALARELHLPPLAGLGVNHIDLPRLAALAESNVSNPSNPLPMSAVDYLHILEQAMSGSLPQA